MKKQTSEHGFTFIEMAIVVGVVGIVSAGALIGIPQYIHNKQTQITRSRMDLALNALSVYSQRHLRLPCPADTLDVTNPSDATVVGRGTERNQGYCYQNADTRTLYGSTEGVLPWKTLGLSERDVVDGWGRYITYKPAPHLTVQTAAPEMQTGANGIDIHNACRTKLWFDGAGSQHIDRQKALFCCNSAPKETYLGGAIPAAYAAQIDASAAGDVAARLNAIVPAAGGGSDVVGNNDPVVSSNRWIDDYDARTTPAAGAPDYYLAGSFSQVFRTDADASLLRASGHAVTLVSHGGNGVFSLLRKQDARLDATRGAGGALVTGAGSGADERHNVWPPETFAASLFHPKASANGAYDKAGLVRGASDDVIAWARSDQLFSRAGDATCVRPPLVLARTEESCANYGNFIYVLDSSGSMTTGYDNGRSRINVAKEVLPEVIGLHIQEESKDKSPDDVGFTRLSWNPDGTLRVFSISDVVLNADYEIDSQANVDRATAAVELLVAQTGASGYTPLFDTILQAAAIANDPGRQDAESDERTALLIISDGYDNRSDMGSNCREGGWCGDPRAATRIARDKDHMLDVIASRYFPIDKAAIQADPGYGAMSREQLFGKVLRQKYPRMDVHIVDMSVTQENITLSDLEDLVAEVGGGSTLNVARDTEDLKEKLQSACTTETALSGQGL